MKPQDTPVRPDGMLVEPSHIISARQDIGEVGSPSSLEELSGREPILAAYIQETMASMAGKLVLSGAPTNLVQGMYYEALTLVLSSLEAQRRGHYEYWKDSILSARLQELTPAELPDDWPRFPRREPEAEEEI